MSRARGYFGIGIYNNKTQMNLGTLLRSAHAFGASFVFTIGRRYKKQCSDTSKSWRHLPVYNYKDYEDFNTHRPFDCRLICVEDCLWSIPLPIVSHPERCIYLLGAEDAGLPVRILQKHTVAHIPGGEYCFNVAVAGSIVMYDRYNKGVF